MAIVQTAIVLLGAVCIRRERLSGNFIMNMGYISGKIVFYTLMGTVSLMCSVFIQSGLFGIPFRGAVSSALLLSLMMAVLFIPSAALGGYTWLRLAMPEIYRAFSYLMPFAHYGDALRSLYLKGIHLSALSADLKWFGWFSLVSFIAAGMGVLRQSLPVFTGAVVPIEEG